ncbi:hypothetical protein Ancab_039473 [Ancistrocladus abbreviatus]
MGKDPAELSQSLPNRKVNDASISTTFKLILKLSGHNVKFNYSGGWNFRMLGPSSSFLFISQCPSPRCGSKMKERKRRQSRNGSWVGERHGRQVGCTALSDEQFPIHGDPRIFRRPLRKRPIHGYQKKKSPLFVEADGLDYMGVIAAAQYTDSYGTNSPRGKGTPFPILSRKEMFTLLFFQSRQDGFYPDR